MGAISNQDLPEPSRAEPSRADGAAPFRPPTHPLPAILQILPGQTGHSDRHRGRKCKIARKWVVGWGSGAQDEPVIEAYPKQVSVRAATAARRQRALPPAASTHHPSS